MERILLYIKSIIKLKINFYYINYIDYIDRNVIKFFNTITLYLFKDHIKLNKIFYYN